MSSQLGAFELGDAQLGSDSSSGSDITLTPAAASLGFTGATPTIGNFLEPVSASFAFTGSTPTVTLVGFNLTPAAASLVFSGGTPTINIVNFTPTGTQFVFVGGTPGISIVRSSATGSRLYIGSTEYYWRDETAFQIQKTLSATWSASFEVRWFGGTIPAPGTDVSFFWEGTKRFGGVILNAIERCIRGRFDESILAIECVGYEAYLDRVIVARLYTLPLGGVPTIIIYDLWQKYLRQFGISLVYPQGQAVGIPVQLFHYITLKECVDRLKVLQPGYDQIITDNKEWKWFLSPNTAAPFTLRDNTNNVDSMEVTHTGRRFRNSQWVMPAVDLASLWVDTATATAGQTSFATDYPLPIKPIVRVNGTIQDVTTLGVWDGSPWYFILGGIGVFRTPGAAALAGGETVTVAYPNPFPIAFNVRDEASITAVGLYENVFQAKDAASESECLLIGAGLLSLFGNSGAFPERLTFTYNSQNQTEWLTPGMSLDVDRTFPRALGTYTVEQVSSVLEDLTMWRHTVQCRSGSGEVTEQQALQSLRTSGRLWVNVPPIVATMEIGIDQQLSVGTIRQAYRFRGSGSINGWDARFYQDPPVGANMIIDLLLNGSTIFPSGNANKIVIPAGSTAEQSGIRFVTDAPTYIDGDVLQVQIIQVGSTTPGKNGVIHLNLKPNTALPPT